MQIFVETENILHFLFELCEFSNKPMTAAPLYLLSFFLGYARCKIRIKAPVRFTKNGNMADFTEKTRDWRSELMTRGLWLGLAGCLAQGFAPRERP